MLAIHNQNSVITATWHQDPDATRVALRFRASSCYIAKPSPKMLSSTKGTMCLQKNNQRDYASSLDDVYDVSQLH